MLNGKEGWQVWDATELKPVGLPRSYGTVNLPPETDVPFGFEDLVLPPGRFPPESGSGIRNSVILLGFRS
jgi:hypothetical protein